MVDNYCDLYPENYYHIFNRANGNEKLFCSNGNYNFFLKKYAKYVDPIANTLSYCLMPNHFHFLISIKSSSDLRLTFPNFQTLDSSKFLSKQFSNLFSSYTQAFNKQQARKGSLFMKNFKRKKVDSEKYLRKLIHYIHFNPLDAGLVDGIEQWKFSSYRELISNNETKLHREEVIGYFDDIENFLFCHQTEPKLNGIEVF